jgi:hypothetical protein
MFGHRPARIAVCLAFIALGVAGVETALAQNNARGSRSDPPGLGKVTLKAGQKIRLNVTCFDHEIGKLPPGPCHGEAMLHTADGELIREVRYELRPGHSGFLEYTVPRVESEDALGRVGIVPCVIPAPGGTAIPTVEVFDESDRRILFENPASPRMSQFNSGFTNPGDIAGFNPQPDPPGFGLVTVEADEILRMNISCFSHPVGGIPPDPCRGVVMFHNAAGEVVGRDEYALRPGQSKSVNLLPPSPIRQVGIVPCILPEPGGRAIPNLEIVNADSGDTTLLINPAAASMSQFQ